MINTAPHSVSPYSKSESADPPSSTAQQGSSAHPAPASSLKPAPKAPRLFGLDSLRALAVLAVIVYHFVPSVLPGGFIGVDVFFVLSGFLITSLLVQEWRARDQISLKRFWQRRARRLLPALALMLVATVTVVGFVGGDILIGLPAQLLGAVTFSSNWVYLLTGASYEAALTPALFNNLWSLAVEEQFYVLWPLAVVAGFVATRRLTQRRSRAVMVASTVLLAVASAALMFVLFVPDHDPTRVYFGTDTHLFGLMLGAVLAYVMVPHPTLGWPRRLPLVSRATQWMPGRTVRVGHLLIALVALAVLVWSAVSFEFADLRTYRGGLLLVDAATVALIAVIVCNQNAARKIEGRVLGWVGRRSYGLYLWHWPILVVVAHVASDRAAGHDANLVTFAVALGLTFACAALSYRFVELPVMRVGLRASVRAIGAWVGRRVALVTSPVELLSDDPAAFSRTKLRAVSGLVCAAIAATCVAAGVTATMTRIPDESSIEASINQGADLIALSQSEVDVSEPDSLDVSGASEGGVQGTDAQSQVSSGEERKGSGSGSASKTPNSSETTETSAKPRKPKGSSVTIIGDSVTLAAAKPLIGSLKGAYVDAEVSRPLSDAVKIMKKLKKKDKLRDFVVISLATNSTARQKHIDAIVKVAGDRKVVFVTGHADRSWIKGTNKLLKKAADEHENIFIADWNKAISKHEKELASDGIHPDVAGAKRYAKVVVQALTSANV